MELDDQRAPSSTTRLLIRPGCRHRIVGDMTIGNVPILRFEPDDEWLDEALRLTLV